MIDTRTGNITYAVLSFGGFMGLGNKLFAVPYPLLRVDTTNECYVLNIEKELLKDAPGFDDSNWPDAANYDFVNKVYSYYGYDPFYDEAYRSPFAQTYHDIRTSCLKSQPTPFTPIDELSVQ